MRTLFTEIGVALLVLALLGCRQDLPPNNVTRSATAVATAPAPTKAEYLRQFCTAMADYEKRHRAWHIAHSDLNDHHFDPSFVPIVQDPLLPIFANPPTGDRATIAAMRDTFERASAKFTVAAQKWRAGDKPAAEAAENDAFKLLFGDFGKMLEDYGVSESTCPSPNS